MITGTGFVPGARVEFGTSAGHQRDLQVSHHAHRHRATAHSPAGVVNVQVLAAGGTSPAAQGNLYAYGAPTVTKVAPNAGPTTGGGRSRSPVRGSYRAPGWAFGAGNYAANVTYKSPTALTRGGAHAPAPLAWSTCKCSPAGGTSPAAQANVYAYGAPTVAKITPNAGPTTGGGMVTITGTGFVPGARVEFGTSAATNVTDKSPTTLTATVPAARLPAWSGVAVLTAGGTSPISTTDQYTYGAPTVTRLSPKTGPTGGGASGHDHRHRVRARRPRRVRQPAPPPT